MMKPGHHVGASFDLKGVEDRKDDVTRVLFISFCRCRVENKKGRISRT